MQFNNINEENNKEIKSSENKEIKTIQNEKENMFKYKKKIHKNQCNHTQQQNLCFLLMKQYHKILLYPGINETKETL